MLLQDKVAVVTGASSGIGKGIALKFASEGCSVALADIADAAGEKLASEISRKGGKAVFIHCDVTNYSQVQSMVGKTLEKFGEIDILVNNAGGIPGLGAESIDDVTVEQWDRILDLNLKSQFLCCKAVVPQMKAKKYGKIINVSSMGAVHPSVSVVHYHTAKAGVIGLTVNLAVELARHNITVNTILPGPIKTPFYDFVPKAGGDREAFFQAIAKRDVPMQRMGTPEDIAGAALFLASELSAFVTGTSLYVGGGLPLPVVG